MQKLGVGVGVVVVVVAVAVVVVVVVVEAAVMEGCQALPRLLQAEHLQLLPHAQPAAKHWQYLSIGVSVSSSCSSLSKTAPLQAIAGFAATAADQPPRNALHLFPLREFGLSRLHQLSRVERGGVGGGDWPASACLLL
jgi:hypothetical protein